MGKYRRYLEGNDNRELLDFSSLEVIGTDNVLHYLKLRLVKMKDVKTAKGILNLGIQEVINLKRQNELLRKAVRELSLELHNKSLEVDSELL